MHAKRAYTELSAAEQERSSSTRRFQFLGAQEGNEPAGRAPPRGNGASSAAPNWSQLLEAMQLTEDQKQVPRKRPRQQPHHRRAALGVARVARHVERGSHWKAALAYEPSKGVRLVLCCTIRKENTCLLAQYGRAGGAQSIAAARRVVTDRLRKIGDERKRLMAALHTFVLEQPGGAGFSTAVDQSDALKSNLENEAVLLQDFHIVFTCKVCTVWQGSGCVALTCRIGCMLVGGFMPFTVLPCRGQLATCGCNELHSERCQIALLQGTLYSSNLVLMCAVLCCAAHRR